MKTLFAKTGRYALRSVLVSILCFSYRQVFCDEVIDPNTLKHLAGHWYVSNGQPATYYFKDADRYLDLFSYHRKDSNKDGIDNLIVT